MEEQHEKQQYEKPELELVDGLQTVAAGGGLTGGCGCGSNDV